jgi:hypothetical protein
VDKHLVADVVAVAVVDVLEVVDVDDDRAPVSACRSQAALDVREKAPVVTAGQGVADRRLTQLLLQPLALRDVDQDAVVPGLAGFRVGDLKRGVQHRACSAVRPADFQLELANRAVACQQLQLLDPPLRTHEQLGRRDSGQLRQRGHPEHCQEGRVGIEDAAVLRRDVDTLSQRRDERAQRLDVGESGGRRRFHRMESWRRRRRRPNQA